jgi:aldose 1-epimerase
MTRLFMAHAFVLLSVITTGRAELRTEEWGKTASGEEVHKYTLSNGRLRVVLTNFGARIVCLEAPDRQGRMTDVVLGYNNAAQYLADPKDFFGAVVGRYGNRIAQGTFKLGGTEYHVPINASGNALHGGPLGFSNKIWTARTTAEDSVEFELVSPDGDMGFPGKLTVHVRYTLIRTRLRIDYLAETDRPTVVNLTNHTYFNLAGQGSGDILQQELRIDADRYTPVSSTLIPDGNLAPVSHTPFDFLALTPIGSRIDADDEQLHYGHGYDHNYVLRANAGELREAAFAEDPMSGRTLTVLTTEPGLQFYSGNVLDGSAKGYTGKAYQRHGGFCLETQHFPDSPHHSNFPSTTLLPGTRLRSTTVFELGIDTRGGRGVGGHRS